MRWGLVIVFLLVSIAGRSQSEPVLHKALFDVIKKEADLDSTLQVIGPIGVKDSPVAQGYKGVLYAMQAELVYNPFSKFRYFKTGREQLETAIALAPRDVELRCLRLSMQLNAPSFLGYNGDIEEDKKVILARVSAQPHWWGHPLIKDLKPQLVAYKSMQDAGKQKLNKKF